MKREKINYKIEDFKKEHIKDLVEIENCCFTTPWTKHMFLKEFENNLSHYKVIIVEGKVVAYAGIWLIVDEGHITNVAVHPKYKGNGFGNIVMQALIDLCKEKNVKSMTLEVRTKNQVAINLYEKYDFKKAGIRKEYYPDTKEDALIMWKEL
ncbi:MAG: ribosomal protein S18-alanine N-acetyltransferase [Peptostreptococcaceae bacterium]|jgi:ribosomal-protein-alanine N-acetyltransferase|nr:ribosomal protein S18-alanine N-acetyltransferase [Peptostreptococcaceae bacterium]